MKKINIGAGTRWYKDGWDVLYNGSGSYKEAWKHYGNVWETNLPANNYNIIFTSHTLEHIPHFWIEKTIAEFNRILKVGGHLRISLPDLEKAAIAYVNKDKDYFGEDQIHPADHLGLGSTFLNTIISPGHQTLAVNREFSQIIGSYAHTYSYDFEMLKRLLEKWGFGKIIKSSYGKSSIEELKELNTIIYEKKSYPIDDKFAREKLQSHQDVYITGFDNKPTISLFVEAIKINNVPYNTSNEFEYTKRNRFDDSREIRLKMIIFKSINKVIDKLIMLYRKIKLYTSRLMTCLVYRN